MIATALQYHFKLPSDTIQKYEDIWPSHYLAPRFIIEHSHDGYAHNKAPSELITSKSEYRNKRVLLLIRDPRDILVSYYYRRKFARKDFSGSLSSLIRQEKGGLRTIIAYYNIWSREKHAPKELFRIRYEDLRSNTVSILKQIFDFVGIHDIKEEFLQQAVQECTIEKMRDVLDQLDIEQLILVSHEQKMEDFVDNIIKIKKENGISSIEN